MSWLVQWAKCPTWIVLRWQRVQCRTGIIKTSESLVNVVGVVQGSLSEQGELLRKDVFSVWEYKKDQRSIRDLRHKSHTRHVFLYERLVVFCKNTTSNSDKPPVYTLKNSLPVGPSVSCCVFLMNLIHVLCSCFTSQSVSQSAAWKISWQRMCKNLKCGTILRGIRNFHPLHLSHIFTYVSVIRDV